MIKLKVEDYCQNCPDFKGEVHKEKFHSDNFMNFDREPIIFSETVVTCVKAHRCANLVRYLKKEIEKNANVGT